MEPITLVGLALSTLISEDGASIGAGVLAAEGAIPLFWAVCACAIGVWVGDLGLWLAGRWLGRGLLRHRWVVRFVDADTVSTIGATLDERLGATVLISRFVPGTRLPTYIAAGVSSRRPLAFALWSLLAVLLWTPLLVIAAASVGRAATSFVLQGIETGVAAALLAGVAGWGAVRLGEWTLALAIRRYHQRFAQTIETPI